MRKLVLLVVAPFLMATQCDDDFDNSGFVTTYFIQNDSGTDLYLLKDDEQFMEIPDQAAAEIGSELNNITEAIPPSRSGTFVQVRLYRMENDNFILAYQQNPVSDTDWTFSEPNQNTFEYSLIITADLIAP